MDPWVRYSVTVYLGLLLAGTLIGSGGAPGDDRRSYLRPARTEPSSAYLTRVIPPSSIAITVPTPG